MWSSAIFASSSPSSNIVSLASVFVFIFSSIFLSDVNPASDLCTSSTPSRTSRTPTAVVLQPKDPGLFTTCVLLIACVAITVVSGHWSRSSRSGRLKREEDPAPPPPPPPPPPPLQLPVNPDATDDEDGINRNDGDGDGEPPQDEGINEQNEPGEDGHANAAAPEPEDPPPPGGLVEEDDDDWGHFYMDGGLRWLVLLLVGSALVSIVKRSWRKGGDSKYVKTRSTTIRGLLERQIAAVEYLASNAPKAPSMIQGLLQRRPQPTLLATGPLHGDPALPAVAPAMTSRTSAARNAGKFFAWRNSYLLLAALPGFAFLVGIIHLLVPTHQRDLDEGGHGEQPAALQPALVDEHVDEGGAEEDAPGPEPEPPATPRRHRTPRAPPPSPVSPRRKRQLGPLPFRDEATQATCRNMLAVLGSATALRMARVDANAKREGEERKQRVREVQRKLWALMYELRVENAAVIGEEGV
ncbi:hypothetical protein B0H16DRAFT_1509927 [Mycena metata]|uniref:Transmembrane protein n=1 Tax=Mycena metata TaxID=1033252 RepID=A0AAD7JZM2_9AGAR|nr:hypothetical protein B0H16DRAFT_1509927 [Mycena metata]